MLAYFRLKPEILVIGLKTIATTEIGGEGRISPRRRRFAAVFADRQYQEEAMEQAQEQKLREDFLYKAYLAASDGGHIFPEHAACEAALESAWGESELAVEANNLFGQKQSHPPLKETETIMLMTREYLRKQWVRVPANWVKFRDWDECFRARMDLLERLSNGYPHYAAALAATNGEDFAREVSMSWSTDPLRADKVLAIHAAHRSALWSRIESGATSQKA
jgi:flagellum-specific peptidoglycan hydrolase FlgJ